MKHIITIIFIILFSCTLSACGKSFNFQQVNDSIEGKRFTQAVERLRRCANRRGPDRKICQAKVEEIEKSGMTIYEFLSKGQKWRLYKLNQCRKSSNPWDRLVLVNELKKGTIEVKYDGEINEQLRIAFIGFGNCSKEANVECMTQYGRMILQGAKILNKQEGEKAKQNALYWLNLAARYGSQESRKTLISLQAKIPTPDLAMERLQQEANSRAIIATKNIDFLNRQMLSEIRQMNFQRSMQSFFPKMVSCTSNRVGTYVYTNCY